MPLAEVILWSRLKSRQLQGYKFRRQYSLKHFVIDFYSSELRLAIEVDGDSHYVQDAPLADIERQNQIKVFDIQFLRFTNQDIYENLEGVLLKIVERIKQITSPTPPCKGGDQRKVQTGNIVYKIDRVHSLHIILYGKEVTYHAVENNKCYEPKDSAYCRLAIKKS